MVIPSPVQSVIRANTLHDVFSLISRGRNRSRSQAVWEGERNHQCVCVRGKSLGAVGVTTTCVVCIHKNVTAKSSIRDRTQMSTEPAGSRLCNHVSFQTGAVVVGNILGVPRLWGWGGDSHLSWFLGLHLHLLGGAMHLKYLTLRGRSLH